MACRSLQDCLRHLDLYGRRNAPLEAKKSDNWFRIIGYLSTECGKVNGGSGARPTSKYNQTVERICKHYSALQILREVLLSMTFTSKSRNVWTVDSPYNAFDAAFDQQTAIKNQSADYVEFQNEDERRTLTLAILKLLFAMSNCTVARKEFFQNGFMILLFSIAMAPRCMCFDKNVGQHASNARHCNSCVKNCAETKLWIQRCADVRYLATSILCNMCHCDALKELIGSVSGAVRLRSFVAIAEHSLHQNQPKICSSALGALRNLTANNRTNVRVLGALGLYGRILQLLRTLFADRRKIQQLNDACEHVLAIFLNASRSVRAVDCITLQTTELFKTLADVSHRLHGNMNIYLQFEQNCDAAAARRAKNQFDSSDEGSLDARDLLDNDYQSFTGSAAAATDESNSVYDANSVNERGTRQQRVLARAQNGQQKQTRLTQKQDDNFDERLLESAQVFLREQQISAVSSGTGKKQSGQRLLQHLRIECVLPQFDYTSILTEKQVGKGTYSSVYSAVYRGFRIAAKVLKTPLPKAAAAREKLLLEFRLMSTLRHPNIVQLMGISCTPNNHLIVCTELCARGSLKENMEKVTSMTQRIRFAKDIIAGLNWMHINNVIHRDLKPANLLVRDDYSVVIADFGLSLYIGNSVANRPVSRHFKGNVKYSAPEILQLRALKASHRGRQSYRYSPATDVYSFALILWELLSPAQKLFGHIRTGRTGITEFVVSGGRPRLVQGWPASLSKLLQRCWHSDPEQRLGFDRIQEQFGAIVIDFLCPDVLGRTVARRLWQNDEGKAVRYSQWEAVFEDVTRIKLAQLTRGNDYRHCLQFMLCDKFGQRPLVTFERFCNMLHYLGSLSPIQRFLDNMLRLFKQGWFFGFIRKEEAASLLAQALQKQRNTLGYFLIRFSVTHKGSFVINLINRDGQLCQRIIAHQFDHKYTVALDEVHPVEYDSLFELLQDCTECETCLQGVTPLNCSPFTKYFSKFKIKYASSSSRHSTDSSNSTTGSRKTVPRTLTTRRHEKAKPSNAQSADQSTAGHNDTRYKSRRKTPRSRHAGQLDNSEGPQRKLAGKTISLVSAARSASLAGHIDVQRSQRNSARQQQSSGSRVAPATKPKKDTAERSRRSVSRRNANNSALLKFL